MIGVKYYDEFIERMQREEVTEIEEKVRDMLSQVYITEYFSFGVNLC